MTKPITLINQRIADARIYLRDFGWAQGTHGEFGQPADIYGALRHCYQPDGYEVIAYRLLREDGIDVMWNDLVCANRFEAMQALDRQYGYVDLANAYGFKYVNIIGVIRLLGLAGQHGLLGLAGHIGPGDAAAILSLSERVGDNPAFEDAHLVAHGTGAGKLDPRVWLLTDALVAMQLDWPHIDDRVAQIMAPVAVKLGL